MRVTRFPARAAGLADRMAGFIAHLRLNGLVIGSEATADALVVLSHVPATQATMVQSALKTLLARDQDSWDTFDALFNAYWFNAGAQRQGETRAHVRTQSARPKLWHGHIDGDKGAAENTTQTPGGDGAADGVDGKLIATRTHNLRTRDLREVLDDDSLRAAEEAAQRLAKAISDRRSRRRKNAKRGAQLDLRRTLRASLARGGDPLDLFRKARPDRTMRIVALVDVSGSMTVYARPFLAFIRGLISVDTQAEAFLFHTKLMRITSALKDHDTLRATGRLSLMAEGFGGGTDIGGSLTRFVDQYGRSLNGRTVVLILSDGYCTGSPDATASALQRIRKRARRIVWLNPLLGWRDYAPVNAAIKRALPYLDAHLPANTIDALAALEPHFARL